MLFMLVSRAKPGTTREQLVERLTRQMQADTWDLVRRGELSHILYKVGDEPGFFALLNAPSFENAKSLVESSAPRLDLFDVDIFPVKHFPHFD
jgi:muconolactone delta-isomerase